MTTFNTLVGAVKAFIAPTAKAPAPVAGGDDAPVVRMAQDSVKLTKRPAGQDGTVQLQRAMIQIADAQTKVRQTMGSLAEEVRMGARGERLQQIQIHMMDLGRDAEKLGQLARLSGRLAANGTASDADRVAFAKLTSQVLAGARPEHMNKMIAAAEDVVRNAGRTPASDRGLYRATDVLAGRIGQVERQMADLSFEGVQAVSGARRAQLQLELQDLQIERDSLLGLKASADRLANKRGATPEALERMTDILDTVNQGALPSRLQPALVEAEHLARHAGGEGDPALLQGTQALVGRVVDVDRMLRALTAEVSGPVSGERLQQIQIMKADLMRDREMIMAAKTEVDRVANGRDELDAGERARLLRLLGQAAQNQPASSMARVVAELQTIGR